MEKYTLNGEQSACRFIDREAVMINAETSAYYSLNQTGSFILRELVVSARSPDEVLGRMKDHFGVASEELEGDVRQTIGRLESEGLISRSDAGVAGVSIEGENEVGLPDIYEKPMLDRHGELEQLILSGE